MAQGEILSPLCCDVGAGRVHCPVNDCYWSERDDYYYLKAAVLTFYLPELHFTDLYVLVAGSITGPWGWRDFNLQMVINLKTITVLLEEITMLLLSSHILTHFLNPFFFPAVGSSRSPQVPFVLYGLIFLKSSKCYSSVEFRGLLNPRDRTS